jgi:hypothetical protein
MLCKDCCWFEAADKDGDEIAYGLCREAPPVLIQEEPFAGTGAWPEVRGESDWCSRFRLDLEG